MRWERGDISVVYIGDAAANRRHHRRSMFILDNKQRVYQQVAWFLVSLIFLCAVLLKRDFLIFSLSFIVN